MSHLGTPGGSADFQSRVLVIRQDPQVIGLARKWARDPDLAEDTLQVTYYKVATVTHPERIGNLHAYFCTALKNEIVALHKQHLKTIPVEDPGAVLESGPHGTVVSGPAGPRPVDDLVRISLLTAAVNARLTAQDESLRAAIPSRSGDPCRYRTVIYDSARQVLLDGLNGEASDADTNEAFRAAYPEYFAQANAAVNLLYQRFRRARTDVKALLQAVVRRDEIS